MVYGSLENPKWHPIGYSSRALHDFDKRYAQIGKDTFSIVFGVEHFHEYLYGRKFNIINDHQPLKSIFSRSIVTCPPRIQKLFVRLQKYDFEFEYTPGKAMLVSDTLSRSYLNDIKPEFHENTLIRYVYFILSNLPISQSQLDQFRLETQKDQILQTRYLLYYGRYYLLVVDYNSKFVAIENFKNSQSLTVINKCNKIFSQYGIPKELITDNGPEFTSHYFKNFSKSWDFQHQTVNPHYHQSNGLAERSIQIVKRTLKKAKYDQKDKYLALLFLNSQPNENGISPARTNLSSVKHLLPQNPLVTETHRSRKTTHSLPNVSQGNTVRIRTGEQNLWDK